MGPEQHLLSLFYCIDFKKQYKSINVRIAHFESFVAQTINVSDNTAVWGRSPQRFKIFTFFK